jgi:DNA replication initiation complex subunit (GINS family)
MSSRGKAVGAASRASSGRPAPRSLGPEDERLNDDINAVLRDAAEQLEVRTRAEATEDKAAARRQFDDVVALARARPGKLRG